MQTKLINSQIQVTGDQWPVFLYADYRYNPEDPWNGLLWGGILVSVDLIILFMLSSNCYVRRSNTFSPLPVLLIKNPRLLAQGMHAFMECRMSPRRLSPMLPHRYVIFTLVNIPPLSHIRPALPCLLHWYSLGQILSPTWSSSTWVSSWFWKILMKRTKWNSLWHGGIGEFVPPVKYLY